MSSPFPSAGSTRPPAERSLERAPSSNPLVLSGRRWVDRFRNWGERAGGRVARELWEHGAAWRFHPFHGLMRLRVVGRAGEAPNDALVVEGRWWLRLGKSRDAFRPRFFAYYPRPHVSTILDRSRGRLLLMGPSEFFPGAIGSMQLHESYLDHHEPTLAVLQGHLPGKHIRRGQNQPVAASDVRAHKDWRLVLVETAVREAHAAGVRSLRYQDKSFNARNDAAVRRAARALGVSIRDGDKEFWEHFSVTPVFLSWDNPSREPTFKRLRPEPGRVAR